MKTVTGKVISAEPISLSKATTLLTGFSSSDNGASQDVSAYLRRASAAFTELKNIHREIKSKERKPISGKFEGGKIYFRESETVSEKESIYGMEQEEIKEDKKKKKSKKNKEVVDEKVNEKMEEEQRSQERRERKKEEKKKKKKKRKSDGEMGSEERERKSKKKRKSKETDG